MKKVYSTLDPTTGKATIKINRSYLLDKYLDKFKTILKNKGIEVDSMTPDSDNKIIINCPLNNGSRVELIHNSFIKTAKQYELDNSEFVPLTGEVNEKELVEDAVEAVKKKLNIILVKSVDEIKNANDVKNKCVFNQYCVNPSSDEYSDVILMIYNKQFDKLREKYQPKLAQVEWN